jgi:hypothetical protein
MKNNIHTLNIELVIYKDIYIYNLHMWIYVYVSVYIHMYMYDTLWVQSFQ